MVNRCNILAKLLIYSDLHFNSRGNCNLALQIKVPIRHVMIKSNTFNTAKLGENA